ncbi:MAG: tetratricopeptide repeat protein [Bacteroidia bacterium]|nr:tetratricopeptide repeat protein [Bacteroidia bacterium]
MNQKYLIWIRLLCLGILIFLIRPLVAQAPTPLADSLVLRLEVVSDPVERMNLLDDLAWEYVKYDLDTARLYAWQVWTMATELQNPVLQAGAFRTLGMAAYNENDYTDAECFYQEAESLFYAANDTLGRLSILNNIGFLYRLQGKCEQASRGYLEGMKLARIVGAIEKEGIIWYNYLLTQISCHAYESAFETGDSLLAFARNHDNNFLYAHTLSQVGYLNYKEENDSLALKQLLEAVKIAEDYGDAELLSTAFNNLGNVYEGLKEYEKAYQYYKKSLDIDEQQAYPSGLNNSYHNIGLALYQMKRYDEAIPYFERALAANNEDGNHTFLPETYYALGKAYAETGKPTQAIRYLLFSIDLQDSLFNENVQHSLQEIKQQYETEKIARELADTQLAMQQQQTRNARRVAWLSAGLVLVFAFAGLVIMAVRRRRVELEKRKIELEYQVLRAQMNPHFIFNALNSIQAYFSERDFAQGNEYLGAFGQLMRRVLEQSRKTSISLAEELETLHLYLQLEQARLRDKFHYSIDLLEDLDESMISIPPLILQPFVENAIWHGIARKTSPGLIRIRCSMPSDRDDLLQVEITDDGIGLQSAARHNHEKPNTSRGISIIRERLGKKGSVRIEEIVDNHNLVKGTRVLLEIPLSDD